MPRMAPTVSVLARQTMRSAFEDLENTVSPVDLKQMRSVSAIQQVRDTALDIEKQLAARRALRNMRRLAPLFKGLEHYSKAIEILSNGTPFLPWIWSPITLILKVASDHIDAFEQIIKGYSKISDSLRRFEILSDAFRSDATFQYSLAVYYSDILQFHKNAYKFVRRSGWHLLFNTSWGRFQRRFDGILQDLDRHGDLIDREANARNIAEAQRQREESVDKLEQEEKHQTMKQYSSVVSWLKVDDTEQIKVFESIHEEGSKYSGTCAWMTKNGKISSWLKSTPNDRQLWISGNPGTGKSVMLTQLVTFLQASESIVLYHFCRDTHSASTRYENILKSLIQQILRSSGELATYAYHQYVVDRKKATTKNLEQLLENLLLTLSTARKTENVWIIVDSIDDCEPAKQAWLISLLYGLTSQSASQNATICKVLFSSRSLPNQTKKLSKKQVVSLGDELEHVSKAIKLYTSQRLRSLHGRLRQLEMSAEAVEHIEGLVTEKADGMFLYARLVLDYLSTNVFFSAEELEQSINKLPATVEEFYQNILAQMLAHLDSRSVDRVRCVLEWVAFAKRPLNRLELLSALAFSSGRSDISSPAPKYVLDLCSPLIHEKQDTTLAFIHGSVKEFLQSLPTALTINERSALQEHGLATITCLLSGLEVFHENYGEPKRFLRLVKGVHGLHVYSTEHWSDYVLANAPATDGLPSWPVSLLDAACRLATELSRVTGPNVASIHLLDERLKRLDSHSNLQLHVAKSLFARSQKSLEARILLSSENNDNRTARDDFNDGISLLLDAYQKAIEALLDQDSCPGASVEELRFFKSQCRTSAYTCRLRSCPRATIGFDSAQSLHIHETGHVGGYRCSVTGCQYPPFRSLVALRSHTENHHNVTPARKTIRKVSRLSSNEPSKSSLKSFESDLGNNPISLKNGRPGHSRAPDIVLQQAQTLPRTIQVPAPGAQPQQPLNMRSSSSSNALPRVIDNLADAASKPEQHTSNTIVSLQEVQAFGKKFVHHETGVSNEFLHNYFKGVKRQQQKVPNLPAIIPPPPNFKIPEHYQDREFVPKNSGGLQDVASGSRAGSNSLEYGFTSYRPPRSQSANQSPPQAYLGGAILPIPDFDQFQPSNDLVPLSSNAKFLDDGQMPRASSSHPISESFRDLIPFSQELNQQQQHIPAHSLHYPSATPSQPLFSPQFTPFTFDKKEVWSASEGNGIGLVPLENTFNTETPSFETSSVPEPIQFPNPRKEFGYVCVDASTDKLFLAQCKDCLSQKIYFSQRNAVEHLLQEHFRPRPRGDDKCRGIADLDDPPMDHLKTFWVKWVEIDVNDDLESNEDVENVNTGPEADPPSSTWVSSLQTTPLSLPRAANSPALVSTAGPSTNVARMAADDQANTGTHIYYTQSEDVTLLDDSRVDYTAIFRNQPTLPTFPELDNFLGVLKCICGSKSPESPGGFRLHCSRCNTFQHPDCYARLSAECSNIHFCFDCRPSQVAVQIANELNRASTPPDQDILSQIITFLRTILQSMPDNYEKILRVFQSLKESQQDYKEFMDNVRKLAGHQSDMFRQFITVLAKAIRLREVETSSRVCVYCDRSGGRLGSCSSHPGMKWYHTECLLFWTASVTTTSFCTSCVLDILAAGEGFIIKSSNLDADFYRALDYSKPRDLYAEAHTGYIDSTQSDFSLFMEQSNVSIELDDFPGPVETNVFNPVSQ
ncbi:hypothetical protein DM02DRAFT_181103 [Periconia macrospinosa]|uniref:C2H2-type domain-containing protein n=1 Tax=Periconia macrospinosa TaxID=97972 RepID=A0A2V1D9K8_9PLEO|nr:hypothetical protein DM02DRAFT_181103 [Periconia macrospinosa]